MPNVEPLREGDPAAVGPYRPAGRLGAGGHGVVYLARGRDGGPVAVKVLAEGAVAGELFAREIAAARQVEASGVARLLDASGGGRPYIVSEYVDGPSLQQAGRLPGGAELGLLAVATATALAGAHQAGLAHRAFKPANVLLGSDGPRVTDFGVSAAFGAGVTAAGSIAGTPAYMAPEQLAGEEAGPPADVFAWASVIVFAATGVPPFGDDSLAGVVPRILHEDPRPVPLPRPLHDVIPACLAKDPSHRPTMPEVLHHLTPASRPAPSTPSTSSRPAPPPLSAPTSRTAPPPSSAPVFRPVPSPSSDLTGPPTPWVPDTSEFAVPSRTSVSPVSPSYRPDAPETSRRPRPAEVRETAASFPETTGPAGTASLGETAGLGRIAGPGGAVGPPRTAGAAAGAEDAAAAVAAASEGASPARRGVRRRVKTVVVFGGSGVSVLALAGAIVWLTPSSPTPKSAPVADVTTAPTSSTTTSPAQGPRRTRTARPEPQSENTPSALPTTDRLTLGSLRPGGGRRSGECWSGDVTFQALVTRTGGPVSLHYTWIIDGAVTGRSSTTITENGRRLLTSPTALTTPGMHSVTLRITAPVARQRTIPIAICDNLP